MKIPRAWGKERVEQGNNTVSRGSLIRTCRYGSICVLDWDFCILLVTLPGVGSRGNGTGNGVHVCLATQLYPTLCDPVGYSPQAPLSMGFPR